MVEQIKRHGIPLLMKNNLKPYLSGGRVGRLERRIYSGVIRIMRRKLTITSITVATLAALVMGIADLAGREDLLCSASACLKVHSSSFSTAFALPVGFYAAAFLFLTLILYIKDKEEVALLLLYALVGIEAYLTFIQVFFIHSLCISCLIFFVLLIVSSVLATLERNPVFAGNPVFVGLLIFFVAHFVFFFPSINLKPTLTEESLYNTRVEIFASPSCSHCEEAIKDLREFCTRSHAQLVVRPVSISRSDVKESVQWVCRKLFRCPSHTAYKLAEKIVWENQEEVRKLNGGTLAVPVIVVRSNSTRELFRGWNEKVKESVQTALLPEQGIASAQASPAWSSGGLPTGQTGLTPPEQPNIFINQEEGQVCVSGTRSCLPDRRRQAGLPALSAVVGQGENSHERR